jgi:quercetin dioxygenase-like cupin family protein
MLQPGGFPEFVRALPEVDFPFSGARGWLLQGGDQQVVFLEIDEPIAVPEHQHEEQWELVLAGGVELNCGGTVKRYEAGESFFIPAGVPHSASVHAGYKALIVFNSPSRYATKK